MLLGRLADVDLALRDQASPADAEALPGKAGW
jgi:hypothetical protein